LEIPHHVYEFYKQLYGSAAIADVHVGHQGKSLRAALVEIPTGGYRELRPSHAYTLLQLKDIPIAQPHAP
jgi:hypothetical protein